MSSCYLPHNLAASHHALSPTLTAFRCATALSVMTVVSGVGAVLVRARSSLQALGRDARDDESM